MQCSGCGFVGAKVAACTGCQCAFYCGVECQTRDWNSGGHKDACHLYRELSDLTAKMSSTLPNQNQNQAIEFRIKRPASASEIDPTSTSKPKSSASAGEDADDDTRASSGSAGSSKDTSPVKVAPAKPVRDLRLQLSPLTRDTLRIIALMAILDVAQLRRASPAWAVLYRQIDWVQFVRSRWTDTQDPKLIKPIGRWLHDYSIFRLYPEALLERSLYTLSPEQNARFGQIRLERMAAQEAARAAVLGAQGAGGDPDDPFVAGLDTATLRDFDIRELEVEYDILFSRVMGANSNDPEVQRAFMNVCILYHMYEHNAREFEAADSLFPVDSANVFLKLVHQQRLQPYDQYSQKHSFFFPVEILTTRIRTDYGTVPMLQVIADEWTGADPECLLEMAQYNVVLRARSTARGRPLIALRLQMANMRNFPKALVKCASIIDRIELEQCNGWSRASFEALSNMRYHTRALTINECNFSTGGMYVDFYGTWRALRELYITHVTYGTNVFVSPAVLRPHPTNPAVPLGAQFDSSDPEMASPRFVFSIFPVRDHGLHGPGRPQKPLPPKQYLGLSEALYVRRVLSVNAPGRQLYEELLKAKMLSLDPENGNGIRQGQPASEKEYDDLVKKFCLLLEKTGISPIEAAQDLKDQRNVALPFRRWFEQGLDYIDQNGKRELILSHARQLCKMSVERRRYVGAYPGVSELAEAFIAWNVSAVNMRVFQEKRGNGRARYCYYVASRADPRSNVLYSNDYGRISVEVKKHDDYDAYSPESRIPHEIVYPLLQKTASTLLTTPPGTHVCLEFSYTNGIIPAWFWLFPKETQRIDIRSGTRVGIPFQIMYHPGIWDLFMMANKGWDTLDELPQWDLFRLAKEAFPEERQQEHGYQHAFQEVYISDMDKLNMVCFPPMDTAIYTEGFYVAGK